MGLIWKIKSGESFRQHSAAVILSCEHLLDVELPYLLYRTSRHRRLRSWIHHNYHYFSDQSVPEEREDPVLREFQTFRRLLSITDAPQRLHVTELVKIYADQYDLIARALQTASQRHADVEASYHPAASTSNTAVEEFVNASRGYHRARELALRRPSVASIEQELEMIWRNCQAGDIIDLGGRTGGGFLFITDKDPGGGNQWIEVRKTQGIHGSILPACAWKWIKEYGTSWFRQVNDVDISACFVPAGLTVELHPSGRERKIVVTREQSHYYSWLCPLFRMTIDGQPLVGELIERIVL